MSRLGESEFSFRLVSSTTPVQMSKVQLDIQVWWVQEVFCTGDKALGVISKWMVTETMGDGEIFPDSMKVRGEEALEQSPEELDI